MLNLKAIMTTQYVAATLRSKLLNSLRLAAHPLDAYGAALASGGSPQDCGRVMLLLSEEGLVRCVDKQGTVNDLASRFQPA